MGENMQKSSYNESENKRKKAYARNTLLIENAIDSEDTSLADLLVEKCLEDENISLEVSMPKDFVKKIEAKNKADLIKRSVNMKNKWFGRVAAAVVILGVSGATVSAAKYYSQYRQINAGKYTLTANDLKESTTKTNTTENDSVSVKDDKAVSDSKEFNKKATEKLRKKMEKEYKENDSKILSIETPQKGDKWESKVIAQRNPSGYFSDDGVNWKKDTSPGSRYTVWKYGQLDDAFEDAAMPDVFEGKMTVEDTVDYTELYDDDDDDKSDDETIYDKSINAVLPYKTGKVEMDYSQWMAWDGSTSNHHETMVITGVEPAKNIRSYTNKNGNKFKMSDNKENGVKKTTTLVSAKGYDLILTFYGLNEKQIHEFLDDVNTDVLL